jgi:hypothetical protein
VTTNEAAALSSGHPGTCQNSCVNGTRKVTFTIEERLPKGVQYLLDSCPVAGDGLNVHVLKCALALKSWTSLDDARDRLIAMAINAGRPIGDARREVERAITKSWNSEAEPIRSTPRWSEPNYAKINEIVRSTYSFVSSAGETGEVILDSLGRDPLHLGFGPYHYLTELFPRNSWLCLGIGTRKHNCKRLEEWTDHPALQLWEHVVPSEQLGREGLTQAGHMSTHSLENCGDRRYLICEFDLSPVGRDGVTPTEWEPYIGKWEEMGVSPKHAQIALLGHICQRTKPTMVVDSGGKSLHAWFYVKGIPEATLEKDFAKLVALCADPRLWLKSQFSRTPGARRSSNGNEQTVLLFNPELTGGAK